MSATPAMTPRLVSVVVPARDEERFLDRCLASIAGQRWPAECLEVVVVENGSRDRTRTVAEAWAARDPRIRTVVCDATNQADAMNAGVRAARGEIVARVDAHSHIDGDYVAEVVAAFGRHPEAAGVGGAFLPAGETLRERVAGLARSSRLGVGGGYGADRVAQDHPVRTVQCGAYRREALLTVGGFDPAMAYGEDEELNWRLRQRGAQVVLCPALRQFYRPRASLAGLWRQYWNYGRGRMRVLRKHPGFLAPRHLAPSALVVALGGLAAAGTIVPAAHAVLALVAGAWGAVLAGAACAARGARWRERVLMPCAVAGMHLAYGAGLLREAVAIGGRWAVGDAAGPPRPPNDLGSPAVRASLFGGPAASPTAPRPRVRLSVIICTKDRPEMLATCLESLRCQTRRPEEIVIVDASAPPARDAVCRVANDMRGCRVALIRSVPGLPRQRNLGARVTTGSVVVYLDDDVVLDAGYLAAIARTFEDDCTGQIGGVGGAQVPDPTPREGCLRRAACRLFLLDTYGRGLVKRSGRPDYAFAPRSRMKVEFLSGCNMAYRREVLAALSFDERLGGYALGEDLQFSYRVSRRWDLVLTPHARLEHRVAGTGRPRRDDYQAMAIFNRYLFFREQVARGPVDWMAYAWSSIGGMLLTLRDPRARGARGALAGYGAVLRHLLRHQLPTGPRSKAMLANGTRVPRC
jgi:glycosyltransferase involved in cell wall biosynthesis